MNFLSQRLKIILNFTWSQFFSIGSKEKHLDGRSSTILWPDTSLHHSYIWFIVISLKPWIFLDVDTVNNLIIWKRFVLVRIRLLEIVSYIHIVWSLPKRVFNFNARGNCIFTFSKQWGFIFISLIQINNGLVFKLLFIQNAEYSIHVLMSVSHNRRKFVFYCSVSKFLVVFHCSDAKLFVTSIDNFRFAISKETCL
jgi:hypothetical protein